MNEIQLCPFCAAWPGRNVQMSVIRGIVWWVLVCSNEYCGARGPLAETELYAVTRWNERSSDAAHDGGGDMTRQLDALIAEHLFDRNPEMARHGLHESGDLEYYWGYPLGHDIAPAYSSDWRGMQLVVEAMTQRGFLVEMSFGTLLVVRVAAIDPPVAEHYASTMRLPGALMPELVARAALKALGVPMEVP